MCPQSLCSITAVCIGKEYLQMPSLALWDCPLLKLAVTAGSIGKSTILQPQHIGNHLTNFHYINRSLVGIRLTQCWRVTKSLPAKSQLQSAWAGAAFFAQLHEDVALWAQALRSVLAFSGLQSKRSRGDCKTWNQGNVSSGNSSILRPIFFTIPIIDFSTINRSSVGEIC